ncbi:MAG: glycoside hydrolase family 20 zincin-like fold domain-containing protein [Chloroflexi bacterium]|nr:glycoside hydrolase family 20 zincin-like fold domain-containing protein [Chloroflexota bacterium]
MEHTYSLAVPEAADPVVSRIQALLQRIIAQRCGTPLPSAQTAPGLARLTLALDRSLGAESYALRSSGAAGLDVAGGSPRGLLYGIGRLLREAAYAPGYFTPGAWRGASGPVMPLRGIYFATHFHNWYHEAPVEELERYVEELALWGTNTVVVWFDQHHYNGLADPAAQAMLVRLKAILNAAKNIGLQVAIGILANEGYANSPAALRADWTAGHNGYRREPQGHYHVEICPSQPGAMELILREYEEKLRAFAEVGLDYIWLWPYDQGGCTCPRCAPWGANGFLRLAEPQARLFKQLYPAGKVILSTWYFDHFTDGEWAGLERAFAGRPDWCDYLLIDDYGDAFPTYPLEHGVPGGLPAVSFPEISMYRCAPWGGWGANPLPQHLQSLWNPLGHLLSGGFPYSEGIYEDINKAVCAQYFWDPDQPTAQTVRQYLAYEFGAHVVTPLHQAMDTLERNLPRHLAFENGAARTVLEHSEGAAEAWETMRNLDKMLPAERRACWRWRVLFLRAQLDAELAASAGLHTPACEAAFQELTELYYAQDALRGWLAPPSAAAAALPSA